MKTTSWVSPATPDLQKKRPRFQAKNSEPQFVLLTPYTGHNMGDGAIQDALIANIRQRFPDARIHLAVLRPARVEALHGVPTLPISGLEIAWYTTGKDREKKTVFGRALHNIIWLIRIARMVLREVRDSLRGFLLLRRGGLVIASGGGQIDDYWGGPMGHPYALFRWAILARLTGARLMFLSIGVCSLESKLSSFFIEKAFGMAAYRSYRDPVSKQLLASMSVTGRDKVVPDLAFSYLLPSDGADLRSSWTEGKAKIGINPIPYLHEGYWPDHDECFFERYLELLADFCATLLRNGHEIVLFPTDSADKDVIELLMATVSCKAGKDGLDRISRLQIGCVRELLDAISTLDCVVVSRLHGAILSHLCNKPVLAISYDRKVRQHMIDLQQEAYCLDIDKLQAADLENTFYLLLESQVSIKTAVGNGIRKARKELMLQYDQMVHCLLQDA